MEDKIINKPRCPHCGVLIAEWLKGEIGIKCPRCHTKAVVSNSAMVGLTKVQNCANSILT